MSILPRCRAIVAGLMEALGDQLSVTFRHFPMPAVHPDAQHTTELAEAAAAQRKFVKCTRHFSQTSMRLMTPVCSSTRLTWPSHRAGWTTTCEPRTRWSRRGRSCEWSGKRRPRYAHLLYRRHPVHCSVALGQMLPAIRAQHPDVELVDAAFTTTRIPRVTWPRRRDA